MKAIHVAGAALAILCVGASSATSGPSDESAVRQAFDMQVLHSPSPVMVGGELWLMYELHVTNFARDALILNSVAVVDQDTGEAVALLEGPRLAKAAKIVGASVPDQLTVEAGRRAVIYLDLQLATAPRSLIHRIGFEAATSTERERATVLGGHTSVRSGALPLLSPPLIGGPWVAVYDPAMDRGHRRVIYTVGGRARVPGRHAIDWMRPGKASAAGAEVLAVADGVVASTRDGVAELAEGAPRPPTRLADATGNFVAIDIGAGRVAFYEHLLPDLRVKRGERVRRGQVIGRLGSTGQANRPHLHFHIANANSPLAAEGLPYRLADFTVIGTYASIAEFEAGGSWRPPESARFADFPTPNSVITFPDVKSKAKASARR